MKNYFLTFMLAVLVVLTGINLRHSVAGVDKSSTGKQRVVAIGADPAPPLPPSAVAR